MMGDQTAVPIPAESAVGLLPATTTYPGAAAAAELIARVTAELPGMAELPPRKEPLGAAWLLSLRGPDPARLRRGSPLEHLYDRARRVPVHA